MLLGFCQSTCIYSRSSIYYVQSTLLSMVGMQKKAYAVYNSQRGLQSAFIIELCYYTKQMCLASAFVWGE